MNQRFNDYYVLSFNVTNIIKKWHLLTNSLQVMVDNCKHTIFRGYLAVFKIIPPPSGYSELPQNFQDVEGKKCKFPVENNKR